MKLYRTSLYVCLLLCFLLLFTERAAAAEQRPALASPLVRMYEGETVVSGFNENKQVNEGTKQLGGTEMYYIWQPHISMVVSMLQFYSSAPGKAYIRIYESENGKLGALLTQSSFDSKENGWQGVPFSAPIQLVENKSYFISYAHEREITGYMTTETNRQAVSLYWRESSFQDFVVDVATPTLQTATANGKHVSLAWNTVLGALSYEVYRDGVQIAVTENTAFVDTIETDEETTYTYAVRARHSEEFTSQMSNSLSISLNSSAIEEEITQEAEEPVLEKEEKTDPITPNSESEEPIHNESPTSVRTRSEEAQESVEVEQ